MITPNILPRAEIVEINEEDESIDSEEEVFHGFDLREVEEALELQQAVLQGAEGDGEELEESLTDGLELINEEIQMADSQKGKTNLSPKERQKQKVAARNR